MNEREKCCCSTERQQYTKPQDVTRYSSSKLAVFQEKKELETKRRYRLIARITINQYIKNI